MLTNYIVTRRIIEENYGDFVEPTGDRLNPEMPEWHSITMSNLPRLLKRVVLVTCLVGGIYACLALARVVQPRAVAEIPSVKALVSADTDFSFRLLRLLARDDPNGNIFISPFSISNALCMTLNGAHGMTQRDMGKTLGLQTLSQNDMNAANRLLLDSLVNADSKATVSIANSLWFDQSVQIVPRFQSICANYYSASATHLHFDSPAAADKVNAWVSNATRRRIPRIVAPEDLSGNAAVLTNAVYFKGDWTKAFRKSDTRDAKFSLAGGQSKVIPLMHIETALSYANRPDFQAVAIPYGNRRLSMVVILPHKLNDLPTVLRALHTGSWTSLQSQMGSRQDVDLYLPRFKTKYKVLLNETLKAAGMESAFGSHADFRNMSPNAARISKVIHSANLEVDEKGSVASAATAVILTKGIPSVQRATRNPIVVRVDHPFLAFIRDSQTGTILFAGMINKPE